MQLTKCSDKLSDLKVNGARGRGDGTPASEVYAPQDVEETSPSAKIVRRKSFTLLPMDENEAIEQMALLEHEDFFIFYNVETNCN